MRGIECAFWGALGRDPDLRTSKAGKPFCGLALAVTIGKSDDGKDVTQWVRATCFGEAATKIAANCQKGDRGHQGPGQPHSRSKSGEKGLTWLITSI